MALTDQTSSPRLPVRERLLEAAAEKFYADGVSATGIDSITSAAGVAKMSLYNNFGSKAALVEVYLQRRHQEWIALYKARLPHEPNAREGVLAVFDAYIDHASQAYSDGFRGCALLNAAAELPADDPGRAIVRQHKRDVEALLASHLATALDNSAAQQMAEQLSFILEGAVARAGLDGTPARLHSARQMAATLAGGL
ncbi:TetR/AcrR family transcriptional regulator [Ornithinimicrobium sp. INDO-MA30-4]|uniref:TetR/AcrR family transcriptional regulator n=1 Tax=Ornithinimicrobium sp. INDO-MA30-4 TaxID=2908651 RepID=UPI001F159BC9|nr:TetR/AcrR family transcriptional regulator [Ornithinimicrobium sp. INDO-MA30-4]UJH71439.1 TetR/AcrR family transcriptional regulator [Ornithinimicrobium sp. INDO-MA30-4]